MRRETLNERTTRYFEEYPDSRVSEEVVRNVLQAYDHAQQEGRPITLRELALEAMTHKGTLSTILVRCGYTVPKRVMRPFPYYPTRALSEGELTVLDRNLRYANKETRLSTLDLAFFFEVSETKAQDVLRGEPKRRPQHIAIAHRAPISYRVASEVFRCTDEGLSIDSFLADKKTIDALLGEKHTYRVLVQSTLQRLHQQLPQLKSPYLTQVQQRVLREVPTQ